LTLQLKLALLLLQGLKIAVNKDIQQYFRILHRWLMVILNNKSMARTNANTSKPNCCVELAYVEVSLIAKVLFKLLTGNRA